MDSFILFGLVLFMGRGCTSMDPARAACMAPHVVEAQSRPWEDLGGRGPDHLMQLARLREAVHVVVLGLGRHGRQEPLLDPAPGLFMLVLEPRQVGGHGNLEVPVGLAPAVRDPARRQLERHAAVVQVGACAGQGEDHAPRTCPLLTHVDATLLVTLLARCMLHYL